MDAAYPLPSNGEEQKLYPNTIILDDDWSLLDAIGDRIAQLFNTSEEDLIGSCRWGVWLNHEMYEGTAHNETEAREASERLLAEFWQAQMMEQ